MGWLLLKKQPEIIEAGKKVPMEDIMSDPVCKIQTALSPFWNQFWCFIMPSLYGIWRFSEHGPILGFWYGYLIFGVLRWILSLHGTWCVNSVAHTFVNFLLNYYSNSHFLLIVGVSSLFRYQTCRISFNQFTCCWRRMA